MKTSEQQPNGEKACEESPADPFARRSRVTRSPEQQTPALQPLKQTASTGAGRSALEKTPSTPLPFDEGTLQNHTAGAKRQCTEAMQRETVAPMDMTAAERGDIERPKDSEQEMLGRCQAIIVNMKAATARQRNISMDIKNGLAELEELIDAIGFCRRKRQETARESTRNPLALLAARAAGTPVTTGTPSQKRGASSPLQPAAEKKKKAERANSWVEVQSKKKDKKSKAVPEVPAKVDTASSQRKKKRLPKPKREALLIKPAEGRSYAEVLREIRGKANPADTGTEVRSIRQTRSGGVLVEFGATPGNKAAFGDALRGILGSNATVRDLEPRETVEIRDLDSLTTPEEVMEAIRGALPEHAEDLKVLITKANNREQKMAIATLDAKGANQLIKAQHIKIGWVRCRVRPRVVVPRCFRCLGYGHLAGACKGPDRSRLCFKCGKAEHKAAQCSAPEYCVLCSETGQGLDGVHHVPGSRMCKVFRNALERAKSLVR